MVRLEAFGHPVLFSNRGEPLTALQRQTTRFGVLIYLACDARSGPRPREEVIATFWPRADPPQGRNALRQALHVIREEIGADALLPDHPSVLRLDPDRFSCDVVEFTRATEAGFWERALSLYRREFLEGFFLKGRPSFERWVDMRRSQLKDSALRATLNLAYQAEAERDLEGALYWWHHALQLQPFREGFVRRILCLLAGSGRGCEAMAEFRRFRSHLHAALGIAPSQETLDLVSRVSSGGVQESERWMRGPERELGPAPRHPPPHPRKASTGGASPAGTG